MGLIEKKIIPPSNKLTPLEKLISDWEVTGFLADIGDEYLKLKLVCYLEQYEFLLMRLETDFNTKEDLDWFSVYSSIILRKMVKGGLSFDVRDYLDTIYLYTKSNIEGDKDGDNWEEMTTIFLGVKGIEN